MAGSILLIWEQVPEETNLFVLDYDSDIGQTALKCAGKYINQTDLDDDDPIWTLSDQLEGLDPMSSDEVAKGPFMCAVVCGFIS